jgi:hypothetical protein
MYTIFETRTCIEDAHTIWSEGERLEFITWLASNPNAGDAIPGSSGCRNVRWSRAGMGKSGGVRIIYFTRLTMGEIWLLLAYAKSARAVIPAHILKSIRQEIERD